MFKSFITAGTWQNRILHIVVATLAFGLPLLTLAVPEWKDVTLGTIVYGLFNLLMHYTQ